MSRSAYCLKNLVIITVFSVVIRTKNTLLGRVEVSITDVGLFMRRDMTCWALTLYIATVAFFKSVVLGNSMVIVVDAGFG